MIKTNAKKKFAGPVFIFSFAIFFAVKNFAAPPQSPKAQYDEAKVPAYVLPDPLILENGEKVASAKTWRKKRRAEILNLFAVNVYGRTMVGRPKNMNWEITSPATNFLDGAALAKTVTIYFSKDKSAGPKMDLQIILPADAKKPVPIFLMSGFFANFGLTNEITQLLISHGYGLASANLGMVEADKRGGFTNSIRKFFEPPGQTEPKADEWGAIGAWAWAFSRAMDYLQTDKNIDAKKICLNGVSRYGKVAMWAGALDERFAIVFSGEAGCGGQTIVRRQFGETIKSLMQHEPYWFADNFKSFGDRVDDLPVDFHELIALIAPRPVYISTAEQDLWGDPRGSFLAAKAAEPVYQLFGERGLGVAEIPPLNTPVGDFIGFHERDGKHGQNIYDWQQFLNFADRHLQNK